LRAVDHVEVLSDGASALYGSDAMAGVVNIVTRKDFDGAETALRYGTSTAGGARRPHPRSSGIPGAGATSTVQSYFSSSGFEGDFAGLGPAGVTALFDDRLTNVYSTVLSSLHFLAAYAWLTPYGNLKFELRGIHIIDERVEPASLGPWFTVENTIAEPPHWKLLGAVTWTRGPLCARLGLNYINAYANTLYTPPETISSWTTADLFLSYKTGTTGSFLWRNASVALSVQNLIDRRPPEVSIPAADLLPGRSGIPFDGANASPLGRYISVQITKRL
jgi:outer membrane receptor protein involved in Fe transport